MSQSVQFVLNIPIIITITVGQPVITSVNGQPLDASPNFAPVSRQLSDLEQGDLTRTPLYDRNDRRPA